MTPTKQVLQEVLFERYAQDKKWGEQNHPNGTSVNLYTGKANHAKAECDLAVAKNRLTWAEILKEEFYEALAEEDPSALRKELVQVAAVASGWIEAIDRAEAQRKERERAARQLPDAPGPV